MTIRANTFGNVQSCRLILTGKKSHQQNENAAPFVLKGHKGADKLNKFDFNSGSYKIEGTCYPQINRQGEPSETKSYEFVIP